MHNYTILDLMAKEKIGEFMVRIGALTEEQVQDILKRQRELEPDKLFGRIAVDLGYLNDEALHLYVTSRKKNKQ